MFPVYRIFYLNNEGQEVTPDRASIYRVTTLRNGERINLIDFPYLSAANEWIAERTAEREAAAKLPALASGIMQTWDELQGMSAAYKRGEIK
jgi:hypothetical protein